MKLFFATENKLINLKSLDDKRVILYSHYLDAIQHVRRTLNPPDEIYLHSINIDLNEKDILDFTREDILFWCTYVANNTIHSSEIDTEKYLADLNKLFSFPLDKNIIKGWNLDNFNHFVSLQGAFSKISLEKADILLREQKDHIRYEVRNFSELSEYVKNIELNELIHELEKYIKLIQNNNENIIARYLGISNFFTDSTTARDRIRQFYHESHQSQQD